MNRNFWIAFAVIQVAGFTGLWLSPITVLLTMVLLFPGWLLAWIPFSQLGGNVPVNSFRVLIVWVNAAVWYLTELSFRLAKARLRCPAAR
jgi:hypothetical protein